MFITCFRSGFRTEMALLSAAARAGSDVNSMRLLEFDPIPVFRNGTPILAICRDDAEEFGDFGHLIVA